MKPPIQIVDDNDKLIGHKLRTHVHPVHDTYRSSGIWIENSKGEVLIAQRALTKDKDPGLWGPAAAGTVDEGETYESNAYKELEEELGLTGITLTPKVKIKQETPRKQFIQIFTGIADVSLDQLKLQTEEVAQAAWVKKAELAADVRSHPEKYVSAMPKHTELLIG